MDTNPIEPKISNPLHTKPLVSASLAVFVLLLAVAAVWYGSKIYNGRMNEGKLAQEYNLVDQKYHRAGDFNEAIPALEKVAEDARLLPGGNNREKYLVNTELRLAANYIGRNQPGDREKAIEIYRSVISDNTLSPKSHAIALAEMASLVHWISGAETVKDLIFNQAPYDAILKDQGGDVHMAIEKLYEMSDDLYPNALSKFQ
ncbi:tetratricopeptide repeat protein, partial [Patescibacteria group bacterium]|nr:tetratricopeptide repeat protein [Patescibacteria group bacterium]